MRCDDYNRFSVLCQECSVTGTIKCCKTKCNQCSSVATDNGSGLCKDCEDIEKLEQHNIAEIIEERKAKEDDGTRYTLKDAKRIFNED